MSAKKATRRRDAEPNKLPSSRRGLAYLLRAVDRCVEAAARHEHRQQVRYQELRRALDDPQRLVNCRPLLDKLAEAALDQLAAGPPPLDAVAPYLDQEALRPLLDQYEDAGHRLRALPHPSAPSLKAWSPWIRALADLLEAQHEIAALPRGLRERLLAALDRAGVDKTEIKTEIKKKRPVMLPEDPKVRRLARMIKDPRNEGRTKKEMALELTGGHQKKAENLLRRWRYWREPLKRL